MKSVGLACSLFIALAVAAIAAEPVVNRESEIVIPADAGITYRPQSRHAGQRTSDTSYTSANAYYRQVDYQLPADGQAGAGVKWTACTDDAPYAISGGFSTYGKSDVYVTRNMRNTSDYKTWRWYFGKPTSGSRKVSLTVVCTAFPSGSTRRTITKAVPPAGTNNNDYGNGSITVENCPSIVGFEVLDSSGGTVTSGKLAGIASARLVWINTLPQTVTVKAYATCTDDIAYVDYWGYDAWIEQLSYGNIDYIPNTDGFAYSACSYSNTFYGEYDNDVLAIGAVAANPNSNSGSNTYHKPQMYLTAYSDFYEVFGDAPCLGYSFYSAQGEATVPSSTVAYAMEY